MNIGILIPQIKRKQKHNSNVLKYQNKDSTIKQRNGERIYIQSKQYIDRINVVWSREQQAQKILSEIQKDVYSVILKHSDCLIISNEDKQLSTLTELITSLTVSNYKYPQVVITHKQQFSKYIKLPQDIRWKKTINSKINEINFDFIISILCIDPNLKEVQELLSKKKQYPNLNLIILSHNRYFEIRKYFPIVIDKLEAEIQDKFHHEVVIKNQTYIFSEETVWFMVYLTVLQALKRQNKIILVTNSELLQDTKIFVNNSFQNVQVIIIDNFNNTPTDTCVIFYDVHINKPFFKANKNNIFIKRKLQTEEVQQASNSEQQNWTTFMNQTRSIDTHLGMSISVNNKSSVAEVFSTLKIKTIQFTIAGSFIRFISNLQDTFTNQDLMVMHSNDPYPRLQMQFNKQKSIQFIRPKQKTIKLLAIVHNKLNLQQYTQIMLYFKKQNCSTLSFRQGQNINCTDILSFILEDPLINDHMKRFIITFEFSKSRRYQKVIQNYLNQSNK